MKTETPINKPETIRERGGLNAKVWRNATAEGRTYYSVTIVRTYRAPDGGFRDSSSFGEDDLLRLARLATRAHDRVRELRSEEPAEAAEVPPDEAPTVQ
jgi:hypothetical protein